MSIKELFSLFFLAIAIFFFLFGIFIDWTVQKGDGDPFYVFGIYALIAVLVFYFN